MGRGRGGYMLEGGAGRGTCNVTRCRKHEGEDSPMMVLVVVVPALSSYCIHILWCFSFRREKKERRHAPPCESKSASNATQVPKEQHQPPRPGALSPLWHQLSVELSGLRALIPELNRQLTPDFAKVKTSVHKTASMSPSHSLTPQPQPPQQRGLSPLSGASCLPHSLASAR